MLLLPWVCVAVPGSCTTLVNVPGGRVDVSPDGVFVDFLGAVVDVTDAHVLIRAPGVHVDVQHSGDEPQ